MMLFGHVQEFQVTCHSLIVHACMSRVQFRQLAVHLENSNLRYGKLWYYAQFNYS